MIRHRFELYRGCIDVVYHDDVALDRGENAKIYLIKVNSPFALLLFPFVFHVCVCIVPSSSIQKRKIEVSKRSKQKKKPKRNGAQFRNKPEAMPEHK